MSITPTCGMATRNSSGRWLMTAPTSRPPFDPPWMASLAGDVYLLAMSHSAAAMKSSKTFCFFSFVPASCHCLAVLAAAAQVGRGVDEALLEQRQAQRAEAGRAW